MVQRILEPGDIEALDHNAIARLRLPSPAEVFSARAARLQQLAAGRVAGIPLAPGNQALQGYLSLMADIAAAQHQLAAQLTPAELELPDAQHLQLALQHGMPPLPATHRPSSWIAVLSRLLDHLQAAAVQQPQLLAAALRLRCMEPPALERLADAVATQESDAVDAGLAPFVAAALQVILTCRATLLPASAQPKGIGTLCPVCGALPVASVIRLGGQAQGYRYLHCGMCASEWHMVRVRCSCCEQGGHIAYHSLQLPHQASEAPQQIYARAETCDDCGRYRKLFSQECDYDAEPLADDLASLALDVLVGEAGYQRASLNPLLWLGLKP